jgi:hypothetical protein
VHLLHIKFLFLKKIKISIFGGISKFHKQIVFGQIMIKFGNFGQLWIDSTAMAMAMADNMP